MTIEELVMEIETSLRAVEAELERDRDKLTEYGRGSLAGKIEAFAALRHLLTEDPGQPRYEILTQAVRSVLGGAPLSPMTTERIAQGLIRSSSSPFDFTLPNLDRLIVAIDDELGHADRLRARRDGVRLSTQFEEARSQIREIEGRDAERREKRLGEQGLYRAPEVAE